MFFNGLKMTKTLENIVFSRVFTMAGAEGLEPLENPLFAGESGILTPFLHIFVGGNVDAEQGFVYFAGLFFADVGVNVHGGGKICMTQ